MPAHLNIHPTRIKILKNLAQADELNFNAIKNFDIDPRNFVFHLNKLVDDGLVEHNPQNKTYSLTTMGKQIVIGKDEEVNIHAFVAVFAKKEQKIATVERVEAPYLGNTGIPTTGISANEFLSEAANRLLKELGLNGQLTHTLMIETVYQERGDLLLHSNMHVFYCDNAKGTLRETCSEGKLVWMTPQELLSVGRGYEDSKTMIDFFANHPQPAQLPVISRRDQDTHF